MPYQLATSRAQLRKRIEFDHLDGDRFRITNPDQSPDMAEIAPAKIYARRCGRPIDTTYLPTRMRTSTTGDIPDMIGDSLGLLVSDKVRQIVEGFEPGVHGFHPITFEPRGKPPRQTHFLWIVHKSIKALNPEGLVPPYPGPEEWWDGLDTDLHPDGTALFSKTAIGESHVWSDPQLMYRQFLSDALTKALLDAEVAGFAPGPFVPAV